MHLKSCFGIVLQRMCWYDRRNTDDSKANVMNQSLNLKENKEKQGLKMWVKREGWILMSSVFFGKIKKTKKQHHFRVDGFEYTKLSGK